MKKFLHSLALCFLLSIQGIHAQELNDAFHSCNTKEANDLLLKNNPNSLKEHNAFNLFSKEYAKKLKTKKVAANTHYIIPVVFHVYGTSFNGKTVTLEKIKDALLRLNEDFKGLNDDFNTVEPFFQARRGTLDIEFRLAQIDPNGKCTTGVVFEKKKDGYGNPSGYNDQIQADAWDNYKYMNVYIQNELYADGRMNESGVCWYPDSGMSDNGLARCVYNGAYLGANTDKEFASVLTHEFGHFLNLIHTFDGGCTGTDEVDDTPIEDGLNKLGCTPGTNCSGDKVNIENYMGYNAAAGCSKMFTQGQVARMEAALQHPARRTLWAAQNLIDTGVTSAGSSLTADVTSFKEDVTNNGAFSSSSKITLNGTTFTKSTGTLTSGVDFTANLPAGLTAIITINTTTQATLTISGTATNHSVSNNTSGGITFLNPAITGGVSSMLCDDLSWSFKFRNPYGIYFVDINDPTVSTGSIGWTPFSIEKGDFPKFGAWIYDGKYLKVETYGKKLVTDVGTKNITPLGFNTAINASSNFTAPGSTPGQLDIRTPTYTVWDGKTNYIGFEYSIDGETCYGWFKAVVSADGSEYSILEYAYNTQPGGTIYTGTTDKIGLNASTNTFLEALSNDGSITQVCSFKLTTNNGTFVKNSGELTPNTDYTITGVPAGLTAKLNVISNNEVQLAFIGNATNHLKANNTSVTVTFLDPAITGGVGVLSSTGATIAIKFRDPYITKHEIVNEKVDPTHTWTKFSITANTDDPWYGIFIDKGNLKFETYTKSLVCEGSSLNITFIDENQTIGGNSNFVAGKAYPNLHNLRDVNYKSWDGRTGYIGFKFIMDGEPCYGWFKVKVNAKGTEYTLLEYFYNTKPYESVTTDPLPVNPLVHLYNKQDVIVEDVLINDGSFSTKIDISLLRNGGAFTKSSGNLVEGTDFTVAGLPAGLTASIKITSSSTAELSYTGKATANEQINGTTATVTFLNPAISGGVAVLDSNYFTTKFVFYNAYKIIEVDLPTPLTASAAKTWTKFSITADADNSEYGVFVQNGNLKLETYTKSIVCEGNSLNITLIGPNQRIDGSNNFVVGGNYLNLHNLRDTNYKAWDGKTGYIGFRYAKDGFYHYGYFVATVSADGLSYSITKYAYNTAPTAPITTPQSGAVKMTNTPAAITEDKLTNDGIFSTTIAVQLTTSGGTFTKSSGNLVEGTDFTVAGLPAGLTASISIVNNTTAEVRYIGKATAHEVANASTATITFLNPAITGGVAVLESKSFTTGFTFINAYNVVKVDLPNPIIVSATNASGSFKITADVDANDNEFALFYAADGLKFLTNKGLVSELGTSKISYVGTSREIGGTNNWNPSGTAVISNPGYNSWNGKAGFIGFRFAKNGLTYYGYFEAAVSADGQSFAVIRYAYNTEAEVPITTPSTVDAFNFPLPTLNTIDFGTKVTYTNYPNPFNEVINISSGLFLGKKVDILIYNNLGQTVFAKSYDKADDTISIDGSNFVTGFYFLKVTVDSKDEVVKKIIKN
ncbi:zinc-dependent metalloprotease [Flavobacterium aestivum]|uniref:zinc-dependent metalloprotease n=1 Tax=Flavobacterium aestivum TaxID=3003257 RepID=UPI0024828E2B|nr:zinc-dependent metalloprotease [Flavobacterium aestivum]